MQIHIAHIACPMETTFAYSNRCLNISLNAQFCCKRAKTKSITLFSERKKNLINFHRTRTRTRKNENVELELAKQAELELELKLDIKIERVRSPNC